MDKVVHQMKCKHYGLKYEANVADVDVFYGVLDCVGRTVDLG